MSPRNFSPNNGPIGNQNNKEKYICKNCNTNEVNIELLLDNALSIDESDHFYQKIESCPKCQQRLEKERSFRSFIQNKTPRHHVSQKLLSAIRDKIQSGNL